MLYSLDKRYDIVMEENAPEITENNGTIPSPTSVLFIIIAPKSISIIDRTIGSIIDMIILIKLLSIIKPPWNYIFKGESFYSVIIAAPLYLKQPIF